MKTCYLKINNYRIKTEVDSDVSGLKGIQEK